MDYPKMLYKGVKPNAYGQLEAEQHTTVHDQDEETQARKAGWHGFEEKPKQPAQTQQAPQASEGQGQAPQASETAPAEQPAAKAPKAGKSKAPKAEAEKPAEG
ncbi:MAG: hypothetical protein ACI4QS_10800 [Comamonas sp.]